MWHFSFKFVLVGALTQHHSSSPKSCFDIQKTTDFLNNTVLNPFHKCPKPVSGFLRLIVIITIENHRTLCFVPEIHIH